MAGFSGKLAGMNAARFFIGGLAALAAGWGVAAEKAKPFEVATLKFTPPANTKAITWKAEAPKSRMRKAQFSVVGAEGTAQCVFYYFGPGQAGGVNANFTRWLQQFSPAPKPADIDRGAVILGRAKVKVHVLKANGTYLDGPPFGAKIPKPNYRLYGVYIAAPRGAVFVKMTGPAVLVKRAEGACLTMIQSAFPK